MQKKEIVMEIIGLYDEITRLQEENKILKLQQGLARITGDKVVLEEKPHESKTVLDILKDKIKREYFDRHYVYHLNSYKIIINKDGEDIIRTFDEWYKFMGIEEMVGYDRDILNEISLRDLKKFFLPELKAYYQDRLEREQEGKED